MMLRDVLRPERAVSEESLELPDEAIRAFVAEALVEVEDRPAPKLELSAPTVEALLEKAEVSSWAIVAPSAPIPPPSPPVEVELDDYDISFDSAPRMSTEDGVTGALSDLFDLDTDGWPRIREEQPPLHATLDTIQEALLPRRVTDLLTTEPEGMLVEEALGQGLLDAVLDSTHPQRIAPPPKPAPAPVVRRSGLRPETSAGADSSSYIQMKRLGASRERETHLVCRMKENGNSHACVLIRMLPLYGLAWDDRRARFLTEADLSRKLSHPGFVPALDVGVHAGRPFYVRAYVTGANLHRLQKMAGKPFEIPVVLEIARQIAEVLSYLHTQTDEDGAPLDLVHGELSTYDVLLALDGQIRLTEVGLSRLGDKQLRGPTGGRRGHDHYAAPEQRQGWPIDARSDLFSLGVILVEMASGESLLADRRVRLEHLPDEIRRRLSARPEAPPELVDLVLAMTKPIPESRVSTAREVADRLDAMLAAQGGRPTLKDTLVDLFARMTPVVPFPRPATTVPPPKPVPAPRPTPWFIPVALAFVVFAALLWVLLRL